VTGFEFHLAQPGTLDGVTEGTAIRRLTSDDADDVLALLVANREAHQPFNPLRLDAFFTVEAQRERLAVAGTCSESSIAVRSPA
jgi:hypothetical protein